MKSAIIASTTYGEFCDLDRVREGSKHSSSLVHRKDEGDACCRFAIAVFPIILLGDGEQLVERHAPFLGLSNDPAKIQFLPTSIYNIASQLSVN
jgi:hypothetical protein